MTHNPDDLMAIRAYLHSAAGIPLDVIGISGNPAHASTGGYHEGNDDLARAGRLTSDYSKRHPRDKPGTNAASALDIGEFVARGWTLPALSVAVVEACKRGDPRTRDIREVIFSPDGRTVRRWDRLGASTTGDLSHRYHTHASFFRDSEGRRDHPDNILGLLRELIATSHTESTPASTGDDDMDAEQDRMLRNADATIYFGLLLGLDAIPGIRLPGGQPLSVPFALGRAVKDLAARVGALEAKAGATALTDTQVTTLTRQVTAALAAAPDVPLGDADKPAIEAALRDVLRAGTGG